jgi:hypothetical protein
VSNYDETIAEAYERGKADGKREGIEAATKSCSECRHPMSEHAFGDGCLHGAFLEGVDLCLCMVEPGEKRRSPKDMYAR